MQRTSLLLGLAVTACGSVASTMDAATEDAPSADAITDTPTGDAGRTCLTDELDGVALGTQWSVSVGSAPTVTVGSGVATFTDAAFSASANPTVPGESWINSFDVDKGNQLRWAAPVGTRNFELTAIVGWDVTMPNLTWLGIGLVNGANQIEVEVGARDSSSGGLGYPHAEIRGGGAWSGTSAATRAGAELSVRRIDGAMIIEHMGSIVLAANSAADIQGLVIVTVRYKDDNVGAVVYDTATLDHVSLCY